MRRADIQGVVIGSFRSAGDLIGKRGGCRCTSPVDHGANHNRTGCRDDHNSATDCASPGFVPGAGNRGPVRASQSGWTELYWLSASVELRFRWPYWPLATIPERPLLAASSTDRCNTFCELLSRRLIEQGLSRPFIELPCDGTELGLAVQGQIGATRKILAQQSVGVFV